MMKGSDFMNAILVGVNINNDYEFDYSIQELENLV